MDRRPLGVAVAVAVVCLCGCAAKTQQTSPAAIRSAVCEVLAKPRMFDGERVIVTADVLSDGLHGTLLVGPCGGGISIGLGSPSESPDVVSLFKAVMAGIPGTGDYKRIRATVSGRFRVEKSQLGDVYELEVDRVEDLTVTSSP